MPGVIGVFTGEDVKTLQPLPCAWQAGRRAEQRQHAARAGDRQGAFTSATPSRWSSPKAATSSATTRSTRSRSTTKRCRPSSTPRRRPSRARRNCTTTRRTTSSCDGRAAKTPPTSTRRWPTPTCGVSQRIVNQRLIPTRDGAARLDRQLRRRRPASTRSGRPRRRRTSTGCCSAPSCSACRSRRSA